MKLPLWMGLGFPFIKVFSQWILDSSLLPHQEYFLTIFDIRLTVRAPAKAEANKIRQSFKVPRLRGAVKGLPGPSRL
jgi:hypothetical protein